MAPFAGNTGKFTLTLAFKMSAGATVFEIFVFSCEFWSIRYEQISESKTRFHCVVSINKSI